ncbi:hypothetical protein EDF24_3058 [Curtobacterium sp. PhB130]|uniref:hypothetical protein n=1 Tax=Curtobacterium sp. PhB130 TaxID=2485178 RepID=UPI000F4C4169|nr:hypothetical protein [Curtobacterium sp. PhB130]ROS74050.1 hypothetical protein EDF24_3058 [Curtobacterium sp. PhB130]
MVPRTIRAAYAVAPLVACVIAFLGLFQADQTGVLGASTSITAVGGAGSDNNARLAASLEETAGASIGTLVREVADRSSPSTERTLLVTGAPGSVGAEWLERGYPDFTRSMTTSVRPMSDLDRYDASAEYQVFGGQRSTSAFEHTLRDARFSVTTVAIPSVFERAMGSGFGDLVGLVVIVSLGCAVLCLVSTAGAPRRFAVRRVAGRGRIAAVFLDLTAARWSVVAAGVLVVPVGASLAVYNGFARPVEFALTGVVAWGILVAPILLGHLVGAGIASRVPPSIAIRGLRPARSAVVLTVLARVPATVLVVTTCFDLVGSAAVVRAGGAERELRAAGDSVQLWVTAEPRSERNTQAYWDRLGAFAGAGLTDGDAFLAAVGELAAPGSEPVPALYVDAGYLRRHALTALDGTRIQAGEDPVVWVPSVRSRAQEQIVDEVRGWSLDRVADDVGSGVLAGGADVFTYPDDGNVAAWLRDPVVVVVPDPEAAFSEDQLGSWLSTGDVVFVSEGRARAALRAAGLSSEISAVVGVGQEAAERARAARVLERIDAGVLVTTLLTAMVLAVLAAVVHRRREGQTVFVRFGSGWSWWRANRALLVGEVAFLVTAVVVAGRELEERGIGRGGLNAATDPAAMSAPSAVPLAVAAAFMVALVSTWALSSTSRRTVRTHGRAT